MSKSIKFKNNTYLDSTGIVHNQKLLSNILYPVNSVFISSTNTNPSQTLGGTWELIDKEFTPYRNADTNVTINTTNTTSATVVSWRNGHSATLRITFVNKVKITDTELEFMTIPKEVLGCSGNDVFYARYFTGMTDNGNGFIMMQVTNVGVLRSLDVVTEVSGGSVPAGSTCNVMINWDLPYDRMDDNACNKFYWKRIS